MENHEKLMKEIKETTTKISDLFDVAYELYSQAVEEVLEGRLTGEKQVEQILNGLIDYGDDLRFHELSMKLYRHIYHRYPRLVGPFTALYRPVLEKEEDSHDLCNV